MTKQWIDFAVDFTANPAMENLEEAFAIVIELGQESEYIEVDEANAALAAAEILATTLGKPAPDFLEILLPVLPSVQHTPLLLRLARKAVKQVVKESELQELWAEGDDLAEWVAIQTDLLARLA